MSRQQILTMFSVIDSKKWDLLKGILDSDIRYERPGYEPLIGIDSVMKFYLEHRIIESGSHKLDGVSLDGHYAAAWGRFIGTDKNGTSLDERFADIYLFNGSKITERTTFFFRPAI